MRPSLSECSNSFLHVAPIFVKNVNEALYKIYRRKTRKDVISMVLMTDIVDDIENIIYWNKVVDTKKKV